MSEIRTKHKKVTKDMKADQRLYNRIYNKPDITAATAIRNTCNSVKRQQKAAN